MGWGFFVGVGWLVCLCVGWFCVWGGFWVVVFWFLVLFGVFCGLFFFSLFSFVWGF